MNSCWPNGCRLAILTCAMIELWSDGKVPQYGPGITTLKPGTVDHSRIAWTRFGVHEGAWRLLRILDRHKIPAAFTPNARVLELYPDVVKTALQHGHTVTAHGYHQDEVLSQMNPDEQRAVIRRTVSVFEKVLGERPLGWSSPSVSVTPDTAGILVEEGFKWHIDIYDAGLPRKITTPKGVIVGIPQTEFSDNAVLRARPLNLFDAYRETFDYLYRHEPGALMVIGFHSHTGGRQTIAAMLDKLLGYMKRHTDVWFARQDEIAQWALDNGIDDPSYYRKRFFPEPQAD